MSDTTGDQLVYSFTSDGITFNVLVTDLGGGQFEVTVSIDEESPIIGDIRAVYLDIEGDVDTMGLTIGDVSGDSYTTGATNVALATNYRVEEAAIRRVESGDTNLNGEVSMDDLFDIGVEVGDQGISGGDDWQSVTFTISGAEELSLEDFDNQLFGIRLTSVGEPDGPRNGSLKISTPIDGNIDPIAVDDALTINEDEAIAPGTPITLNVLANDSDPDGDVLTVVDAGGVAAGTPIAVTTANGVTTTVTVASNGDLTFDTAGLFDNLNDGETDSFQITYTADDGNGGQDEATVTITINGEGQPQGDMSWNIVFLVDSAGTAAMAGAGAGVIGSEGSLDLNGDGAFDSYLDAELNIVAKLNDKLASLGLGADVEVGLFTFDTDLGFSVSNEPASQLTAGSVAANGAFCAGEDLSAAFLEAEGGAVASYNSAIAGANSFLFSATANDTGTSNNLVFVLTEGLGFDWTLGGDDPVAAELNTLVNTYMGSLDTIVLSPSGATNTTLAQMESIAGDGVVNLLDSEADVIQYVNDFGNNLIV